MDGWVDYITESSSVQLYEMHFFENFRVVAAHTVALQQHLRMRVSQPVLEAVLCRHLHHTHKQQIKVFQIGTQESWVLTRFDNRLIQSFRNKK